ncbi:HdaA/DnaA family protein [Lichenifustis flavocetrariae]|uniref:DnaA/Hda family protein n=1 Tax=Lichenifustis flavocetrariae TaxID=2949735 RepID=A0AA41Z0Y7_9HYPH|nr:DnaA/Hda family protein [Lichenifustis flavocetrariae]MCW6510830.1 DnaA/Hda family protein [Lichenifustis flavocetrariae]
MRQLALDLPLPSRLGMEDFLVAPANQVAFETIERWPQWPGNVLVLVGPEGSGKSHLAAIWAERAAAFRMQGGDLETASLDRLEGHGMIDDADQIGPHEARLFHVLNILRENGRFGLLTARSAPDSWGVRTPDLLSRLRLAPMLRLLPPDEALVSAVLIKLLADRQLTVDTSVVDFLCRRMERSIATARRIVAALDAASLASGRRVTRATAAEVLASLEAADASRHGLVTGVAQNAADPNSE